MAKPSPNLSCPCSSGTKYKRCCQKYHKGALPHNAELLMRSRYSAYALGLSDYIINTTHPDNPDYNEDTKQWREEIDIFSRYTQFEKLEVITFTDGESEAYVSFRAFLSSGVLTEKSRFLKEKGKWLYVSGEISQSER